MTTALPLGAEEEDAWGDHIRGGNNECERINNMKGVVDMARGILI